MMDHEAGRECLLEVAESLDTIGFPWFLMQGTALGAYRDRGFVPTEKDIDIGVLQESLLPSWRSALMELLIGSGFDIEVFTMPFTRPRTIVAWKYYGEHCVKVDIVGMARWKDKRFTAIPCRPWIDHPYCLVHDAAIIENTETIELFGRTFQVPSPIETYLEREYGEGWRTPSDDHVSRTRQYDWLKTEGIPRELLES